MNTDSSGSTEALAADGASSLTEAEITLGLLSAVEENHTVTQRSIASELGIALGLTNAYLKRCIKKGYIKVSQIPRNRFAYYLTPKGFAEKSRLTAFYLSQSFRFFRSARSQCETLFGQCVTYGWTNVVLIGVGDLGEIAFYCGREHPVHLVGFLDFSHDDLFFVGLSVSADPAILREADAAIVTDLNDPQGAFDFAVAHMSADRVLTPSMLKISRRPRPMEQDETP